MSHRSAFLAELNEITKMLDIMILPEEKKTEFLDVINNLRGRVDELANPATSAILLDDLVRLKKNITDYFSLNPAKTINLGLDYAMESADLLELSRLISEYHRASEHDKFEALRTLFSKIATVAEDLKSKGILKDDNTLNVGTMTKRQEEEFKSATASASNFHRAMNMLKEELAHATSEEDVRRVIKRIDSQLKMNNSTNRRLDKLRRKVGGIEPHQRSIKIKAVDAARLRNQTVADELYDSPYMTEVLDDLAKAYDKEKNAANATELYRAKKEVKRAERAVYGKRLTRRRAEKIDRAYEQRKEIIANAQATTITGKREYRKKFKKTMKQLEKVDRKIIGKENARELYWGRNGLRSKAGYLVGGTSITLPKQVVELESSIKSASR